VSRILLLLLEEEGLLRAIDWALFWANIFKAAIKGLIISDRRLFHFGEVDPLASTASRKKFLAYLEEEESQKVKKLAEIFSGKVKASGLFYSLETLEGPFEENLLGCLRSFKPHLLIWPLSSGKKLVLAGKLYHPQGYLRKIPCKILFVP